MRSSVARKAAQRLEKLDVGIRQHRRQAQRASLQHLEHALERFLGAHIGLDYPISLREEREEEKRKRERGGAEEIEEIRCA